MKSNHIRIFFLSILAVIFIFMYSQWQLTFNSKSTANSKDEQKKQLNY